MRTDRRTDRRTDHQLSSQTSASHLLLVWPVTVSFASRFISISPVPSTTFEKFLSTNNILKQYSYTNGDRNALPVGKGPAEAARKRHKVLWDIGDVCFCCRRDKRIPQRQTGSLLRVRHACYSALHRHHPIALETTHMPIAQALCFLHLFFTEVWIRLCDSPCAMVCWCGLHSGGLAYWKKALV